jgi:hypothetical protein
MLYHKRKKFIVSSMSVGSVFHHILPKVSLEHTVMTVILNNDIGQHWCICYCIGCPANVITYYVASALPSEFSCTPLRNNLFYFNIFGGRGLEKGNSTEGHSYNCVLPSTSGICNPFVT